MTNYDPVSLRILLFIPFGKDAQLASAVLVTSGITCCICRTQAELGVELARGVGAVLTAEEALPPGTVSPLDVYIASQPTWSDLPVLVLTKPGGDSPWIKGTYERLGNLTLLERPVRTTALISASRSALRARQRQYEIRLADQRKDEFLAMLAHELRNPMAPISAAAQMLARGAVDFTKMKLCSEIINRQISHMTNLIDDLLDVARVTRGMIDLDREALDVGHILSEAVEQVTPLVRTRRHHLTLRLPTSPALVFGDRKRLIQVMVNLLNNASKYTPEEGQLTVETQVTDQIVMLKVSDNGIGMAPDIVDSVFEIFTQAERTSDRSQGGLGLGLALVKSLVTAHGGSVKATSPGLSKGSTFTVSLPRWHNAPEEKAGEREQGIAHTSTPLQIMVVDDNVDAASTLAMCLETMGHEVAVEHHASAAIERARESHPQVCLLDIGMPDVDGYELARQLIAQDEMADTVLIAITGYGQERDKQLALDAGFHHHFVKPVDMTRLIGLLAGMGAK
ncbi:MAG: ATP-binding protein [Pseudomonadota bacterium]